MLALPPDLQRCYARIQQRSLRFFVRMWLDTLFTRTHVHWRFHPLSILTLSYLWSRFYYNHTHTGYSKQQLVAIKALARRREYSGYYFHLGEMPRFDESLESWAQFFELQRSNHSSYISNILTWCRSRLLLESPSFSEIYHKSCELLSILYHEEIFDNQIFLGVKNYILDPKGSQEGNPEQRLPQLFEFYLSSEPPRVLAYTELVPTGRRFRTRASLNNHWTHLYVEDLADGLDTFASRLDLGSTVAVKLEDKGAEMEVYKPLLLTVDKRRGGMAEYHRRQARVTFSKMLQGKPSRSTLVFPPRSYCRELGADKNWYHDTNFEKIGITTQFSGQPIHDPPEYIANTKLYHNAANIILDFPEEALWYLMVGMETRWGDYQKCANAYRWGLRTRLGEDVTYYRVALSERFKNIRFTPGSTQSVAQSYFKEGAVDYEELRKRLDKNSFIGVRLAEICEWYADKDSEMVYDNPLNWRCHTWREIEDLLTLGRGIRNLVAHTGFLDENLYGAALYIAKVACEAFVSGLNRDMLARSHSETL